MFQTQVQYQSKASNSSIFQGQVQHIIKSIRVQYGGPGIFQIQIQQETLRVVTIVRFTLKISKFSEAYI